jgi:DNA polymerase elongation subunit (family B)
LFIYDWHVSPGDGDDSEQLYAYALDADSRTHTLAVQGFKPWVYIDVASDTDLDMLAYLPTALRALQRRIVSATVVQRKVLYGAAVEPVRTLVHVRFMNTLARTFFVAALRRNEYTVHLASLGRKVPVRVYDAQATPVLQYVTEQGLTPSGWVYPRNLKPRHGAAAAGQDAGAGAAEWTVMACNVRRVPAECAPPPPAPRVVSFDIECFSSNPSRMPDAVNSKDCVFQIAVCASTGENVLLTLGHATPSSEYVTVECASEAELLVKFVETIQRIDPHIITGYNIFRFDIPYLLDRARLNRVDGDFMLQGVGGVKGTVREIRWSSSAFSSQQFKFLAVPGRVSIDMLPVVQRDFKFDSYKLKTVSEHFLGETKDPMTPRGIFAAYELGVLLRQQAGNVGAEALARVGKYCVQDAALVLRLFRHLQTFVGCVELSAVMHVPISVLFTQGQQIRVYSQVFRECFKEQRVVNRTRDDDVHKDGKYQGAYVFDPRPGVYDNVVSFDFNSLYPTTQQAYNICPSTHIPAGAPTAAAAAPAGVHVITVGDAGGGDTQTERFMKQPEGVLPRLLRELLEARAATRAALKKLGPADAALAEVLDKRQLALKVSANSVYGSMGAGKGYLPFLEGAAATTAAGRANIARAAEFIQTVHRAELVYGDTDSVYVRFPEFDDRPVHELWDHCLAVEKSVSALFPAPMYMAFEEAVYRRYLILSKKRYVCTKVDRRGDMSAKLTVRGIVLTRRDNSNVVRAVYEQIVKAIFDRASYDTVYEIVLEHMLRVLTRRAATAEYVITKSVKEPDEYAVPALPVDEKKRRMRLEEVGAKDEDEYRRLSLPAHVQLMVRMRERGEIVDAGQRLEYVVCFPSVASPLGAKLVDVGFFNTHADVLRVDYLYYLRAMINPVDQVVSTLFPDRRKVAESVYAVVAQKHRVQKQLLAERYMRCVGAMRMGSIEGPTHIRAFHNTGDLHRRLAVVR